jgi:predicted methyltransferase
MQIRRTSGTSRRNLPPTLRLGQKDRAKYLAIGESDRMTLKFTKPKIEAQAH